MRRGFKTEANSVAVEVRSELGLRAADPLDPWRLAEHLAIPVIPLSAFARDQPQTVRHFTRIDPGAFSGATVFCGPGRLIVINDAHAPQRQASDLAHELAHALLQHPAVPALDHSGCRDWNGELEEEAEWLAGALLISEDAALSIVRRGLRPEEAAALYGVSTRMLQFRLNVTGARARVERARARRSEPRPR